MKSHAVRLQDASLEQVVGGRYVEILQKHLRRLHDAYGHGNRKLFYDELVTAYLLAFFNPTLRSLRSLEDFSELTQAGEFFVSPHKLCRSTVSDANALMDARLLEPIIQRLRREVPALRHRDGQLARLLKQVQMVDGSFFAAAATVTWALRQRDRSRDYSAVRLNLRLDGGTLLPARLSVSGRESSEPQQARQAIERGVIYVLDRGFQDFRCLQAMLDGSADFVLRATTQLNFVPQERTPLDAADREAQVIRDHLGHLGGSTHARVARIVPQQTLREVIVFDPHNPDKPIRLITSILDLPAHIIAMLYRWRWQIELFFRWLKVHAQFRHLISRSRNGMTLGFYVAVIAVLLIYLRTGRPMSKYAYNLLALVAAGYGDVADLLPILERREKERQRERERQAAKRAAKKSV